MPCKDDHESQSPEDTGLTPRRLGAAGVVSLVSLPMARLARSAAICLEGCWAGMGEMPLEGGFEASVEREDWKVGMTDSCPTSSLNEMSLLFRGRSVDVGSLEAENKTLLLFIAAAVTDQAGFQHLTFAGTSRHH